MFVFESDLLKSAIWIMEIPDRQRARPRNGAVRHTWLIFRLFSVHWKCCRWGLIVCIGNWNYTWPKTAAENRTPIPQKPVCRWLCPSAVARITCGKSQTPNIENRAEKSSTEDGLEETSLNRSVPQAQGVYVCVWMCVFWCVLMYQICIFEKWGHFVWSLQRSKVTQTLVSR